MTESDYNSIATTKWVNEKVSANVSDFGNWETPEATGTAAKSGIFTIISKHNTKVEIFVDESLRVSTDKRDSYGTGPLLSLARLKRARLNALQEPKQSLFCYLSSQMQAQ